MNGSDHEIVEFGILRGENQARSRITMLDFRRADLACLRTCSGRILWEPVLEHRGVQDRGLIFKDHLIYAPKLSIPTCRNSSKGGRKPEWMKTVLQTKLKHKVHNVWKQR